MLEADRDYIGDHIDFADELVHDGNMELECDIITALFGESIIHGNGQFEPDDFGTEDENVTLGNDAPAKGRH